LLIEELMAAAGLTPIEQLVVWHNVPHLPGVRGTGNLVAVAAEVGCDESWARKCWDRAMEKLRLTGAEDHAV
jgi:hypothetical protein